ncbi:MAG TPA: hypothetical protein VJR47_21645 [Stellaceae bacterium]|nr:hypothetical protein [Stellaceae bacterium]
MTGCAAVPILAAARRGRRRLHRGDRALGLRPVLLRLLQLDFLQLLRQPANLLSQRSDLAVECRSRLRARRSGERQHSA